MIREDLTNLYFMSQEDIPELLNNLDELDEVLEESKDLGFDDEDIESEEDEDIVDIFSEEESSETEEESSQMTQDDKDEAMKAYEELKNFRNHPEINNLPAYIEHFEEEITKVTEKYNNKEINDNIYHAYIDSINKKIDMLNNIYSLEYIIDKGGYGKFKKDKLDKFVKQARKKMEESKYEFIDLSVIIDCLEKCFKEQEVYLNILMKLCMYLSMCKKDEILYVYFVFIGIMSINNENMLYREEMKDSLYKLYEL